MPKESITIIILAGGQGSRMGGRDKGWVEYQGKPMIEQIVKRLETKVSRIIISANRNIEAYEKLGHAVVRDTPTGNTHSYEGPIAGIIAGLETTDTDFAMIIPCDAPNISIDLIDSLNNAALASSKSLFLFNVGDRLQPLFGLYHRSLLPELKRYFLAGNRKLIRWCEAQHPEVIEFTGDSSVFANINTPEELNTL